MKLRTTLYTLLLAALPLTSCDENIYDRIPAAAVHIEIDAARWVTYGIHGMADTQEFILNQSPAGFQYNVSSATGFGGVLLVGSYQNEILAFDLSCPVERSPQVRIRFDEDNLCARCDKCGSTYDVFSASGAPMSGEARSRHFFLQSYRVLYSSLTGGYTVTR